MIYNIPPALLLILGAPLVGLTRGWVRRVGMLLVPLAALFVLTQAPEGEFWSPTFLGGRLILGHIDALGRVFAYIFCLAGILGMLFAIRVDDGLQHAAAMAYVGGGVGVVLAGDFISLYVFWEIMAVASAFLVLARRTPEARAAALRYILVHLAGGLLLLAGIVLRLAAGGGILVGPMSLAQGPHAWLILAGVLVNAACVPLHPWLPDAYPQATYSGAVFLSAFTTKSAVYVLARCFPGQPELIWLGMLTALAPLVLGLLTDDVRRLLAYCLINQVGFMICGVGLGTDLALAGVAAHAFYHILYKSLLFMVAGSVLWATGQTLASRLGGLGRVMPWTLGFAVCGAVAISGFCTKSMIISAAAEAHHWPAWLALNLGSAGVFLLAGLKFPMVIFAGPPRPELAGRDPGWHARVAMGLAALGCLVVLVRPGLLYALLPWAVDYHPHSLAHHLENLQLLGFTGAAFWLAWRRGWLPATAGRRDWDLDWFYIRGARVFYRLCDRWLNRINDLAERRLVRGVVSRVRPWLDRGPATLALLFMDPYWRLTCRDPQEYAACRTRATRRLAAGATSVGLGAGAAALMLAVMFLLNQG